jgi:hypothetical protein
MRLIVSLADALTSHQLCLVDQIAPIIARKNTDLDTKKEPLAKLLKRDLMCHVAGQAATGVLWR